MAEDVLQYNNALKKAHIEMQHQQKMKSRPTKSIPTQQPATATPRPLSGFTHSNTSENNNNTSWHLLAGSGGSNEAQGVVRNPHQEGEGCLNQHFEQTATHTDIDASPRSRPKKIFSLNLPGAHSVDDMQINGELYGLQSALSFASLASSNAPYSARSSLQDSVGGGGKGGEFETSRSQSSSQQVSVDRVGIEESEGHLRDFKSSRKSRPPQKPLSILEQKMMERTMQSLKNNIVKKQVVMNKEFEGKSFITKPNILRFDDFEVGCSYTKKITVTNVSLSFNTFKVLELPVRVSDFFKILYAPPGRLSAGTGVPIDVTFTPALPTPIFEKLVILAETGQFEIPIECLPKQCKVSLSTTQLEFENISLGETQVRTLKLSNNGGLESNVDISFSSDACGIDGDYEVHTDVDGKKWPVVDTVQSAFVFQNALVLQAYSTHMLDITFTPSVLGSYSVSLFFRYKGPDNVPTVTRLLVTGTVTDVPIYLDVREIDFMLCYCGQLYRDCFVLHNRGKVALKSKVKVPSVLKKYVTVVPRVAFVQANSSLSIQLKFKPTLDLLDSNLKTVLMGEAASPETSQNLSSTEQDDGFSGSNTTLGQDAAKLDPSRAISLPVTISVASICSPIWFQLKALVTNALLTVQPEELFFGECSINESVEIPFCVTNQSVSPIRYGFVHLPKEIQIVPSDGFGTLLPLEEMKMVATFSPLTATQHTFALTIKTDQGDPLVIPCSGIGVKPSLQFLPAIITIPPTSLGDVNTADVFLENISKVTQIFEICVPDHCPFLLITPIVQTLLPGLRAHIKIDFEPANCLKVEEEPPDNHMLVAGISTPTTTDPPPVKPIGEKSLKPHTYSKKMSSRSLVSPKSPATPDPSPDPHSSDALPSLQEKRSERKSRKEKEKTKEKDESPSSQAPGNTIDTSSDTPPTTTTSSLSTTTSTMNVTSHNPLQSQKNLPQMSSLPLGQTLTWKIPCFSMPVSKLAGPLQASSGEAATMTAGLGQPVVYLEISATVAPPTLVRVLEPSEHSNLLPPSSPSLFPPPPPVHFGQVPIGQSVVKKVTIRNNSPNQIKPQLAAVYGNMTVLNAVRPMLPRQSQVLQIQYKPDSHGMHLETIELTVGKYHRLIVPVQGQGVSPKLTIEPMPDDNHLDFGYTIVRDSSKKEIKLVNASQFAVGYHIHLLRTGPKNINGINPFSVVPDEGDVPVGGEKVITIAFEPDHENHLFHDELQIEVKSESTKRTIYLKGGCTGARALYMLPDPIYEERTPPIRGKGLSDIIKPGYSGCIPRGSYTLNFTPTLAASNGPIVRTLVFGNAKVKREKGISGEVIFEPLSPQGVKDGFSIEGGLRYVIEPDSTRTINFQFDPDVHCTNIPLKNTKDPNMHFNLVESLLQGTVETSIKCTLKGGYSAQDKESSFTLILIGHYVGV
eukprot:Phypoly_transcript_00378.p1 GENE.Phypoly_transcript_00378~~Phypoly_transcript_00378.p1  ORF type:complete len:1662 (-),score=235.85 Phypoly_transcript_00378:40-4290(-)